MRGSGEIASNVDIQIVDVESINDSTRENQPTSSNRNARNSQCLRPCRRNVDLGLNANAFLPPSTRGGYSVNIDRMEQNYNYISS